MLKRFRKPFGLQYCVLEKNGVKKKRIDRSFWNQPGTSGIAKKSSSNTKESAPPPDPEVKGATSRSYQRRKTERSEGWKDIFQDLVSVGIDNHAPSSHFCTVCEKQCEEIFRCIDCGPLCLFCRECLQNFHQMPHLHFFECFKNGTFLMANIDSPMWKRPSHVCQTNYFKELVILDDKGRQHMRNIKFCRCESEAQTLIRFRLWPSTPKSPSVAVDFGLLDWMTALMVEGHLSTKAFCESIKWRATKHYYGIFYNFKVKHIYRLLIDECLVQYRHFQYRIRNPHVEFPNTDDGTSCPACFEAPLKIFSMDADFQLVRKRSSGKNIFPAMHEGRYFQKQEVVDSFINEYARMYSREQTDKECSSFQAASSLRTKVKNKKLDETAVFGTVCRHEMPVTFFNLRHGERLAYSVFLLEKFISDNTDSKVIVMYDIACLLEAHLKSNNRHDILEKISLVVPVFHCYGHKMACQVLYNPRRTSGVGLTDGEACERLWSYLGRFSNITKEMTVENKVDLLTDALLHYTKRIKMNLGHTLVNKFKRTEELLKKTNTLLDEILEPLEEASLDVVKNWSDEEKLIIKSFERNSNKDTSKWEENYASQLETFFELRRKHTNNSYESEQTDMGKELEKLEVTLKKIESRKKITRWAENSSEYRHHLEVFQQKQKHSQLRDMRQLAQERHFFVELIKKYAKGQSVAKRLQGQLKKINKQIKKKITLYNQKAEKITFENVINLNDSLWEGISSDTCGSTLHRQAIDIYEQRARALEELDLLKLEMKNCMAFYEYQHSIFCGLLENVSSPGPKSLLISEGLFIENHLNKLYMLFSPYVQSTHVANNFHVLTGLITGETNPVERVISDVSDELLISEADDAIELFSSDSSSDEEEELNL